MVLLSFSSIIPLVPPFLPLQEVKWWHLLRAVITVWFQYSKWAISPTASGRCSLPCPININTHTHRGASSLICMEREIVQVCSCGREGLMNFWRYLIILTLLCARWCCICIFAAVLSPSGLFTVARWWQTASAHVHLRHCHFWLSHEGDVMWCAALSASHERAFGIVCEELQHIWSTYTVGAVGLRRVICVGTISR